MGVAAVDALLDDQKSIMIGLLNNKDRPCAVSNKAIKLNHSIDEDLIDIKKYC
jgi:6-phosphofructokinase 1